MPWREGALSGREFTPLVRAWTRGTDRLEGGNARTRARGGLARRPAKKHSLPLSWILRCRLTDDTMLGSDTHRVCPAVPRAPGCRPPGARAAASRTHTPPPPAPRPQVPEIVQYVYHSMDSVPEPTAQGTVNKVLQLLAQAHADDVIPTLFQMQDQCRRWAATSSARRTPGTSPTPCFSVVFRWCRSPLCRAVLHGSSRM